MQVDRAWALHFLQHVIWALKKIDHTSRKNRKDSATHLLTFVKECCERDRRAVALFMEDLLSLYHTAASPTRRVLVDVLLSHEHDWSLLVALAHDSDAHIRARALTAAATFDAGLVERLVSVNTTITDY